MLRWEGEQLDEWQLYVEGRERAYGFLGEEMVWLCCVGREQLDEWQLYVEGRERAMVRLLGEEMVWSMLRRKRNSLTSGNCTLRDEKEPMVFWARWRWSALEGEQLDEWQLYVEGRERSYGTFAGR
jgi:hypothetical protein